MSIIGLCGGCSVLTPIGHHVPKTHAPKLTEVLEDNYHDFVGVIHIHTIYSDGAGTYEDVARVANQLKLDYLIVTDHNTLQPLRDGKPGWYGMTLVATGMEISTRSGHFLAMNVRREIDRDQPTQAIIDEVNRQGGLGFIAHPFFKKRPWTDWTVHGFTGIEGYNTVHDAFDDNRLRIVLWGLTVPPDQLFLSFVDRPDDPLATWDRLLREHPKVVGIGSSDAHEFRIMGVKIAPYDIMFKLVRTHVLLPEGTAMAEPALYESLRAGHAYFSIDLVADASGFSFFADNGREVFGIMGDDVPRSDNLQVTAVLPAPAQLTLIKDGQQFAEITGRVWHVPIKEPGIYRLEAALHGKPWIFSNPIYVKPAPVDAQPRTPASPQQTAPAAQTSVEMAPQPIVPTIKPPGQP